MSYTKLKVKCSRCQFLKTDTCSNGKCVDCVVFEIGGRGCVGIDNCRRSNVIDLERCKSFKEKILDWDQ